MKPPRTSPATPSPPAGLIDVEQRLIQRLEMAARGIRLRDWSALPAPVHIHRLAARRIDARDAA